MNPQSARHEPAENDVHRAALLKGLIDTIEFSARQAISEGLGDELRARLARVLGEDRAAAPAAEPAPAPRAGIAGVDIDRLMGLLHCVQALDEHARRVKADSPAARRDATCRDFLRTEIERLKGRTTA